MKKLVNCKYLLLFILMPLFFTCSSAPITGNKVDNERLIDGEYEGTYSKFPNSAHVKVTIKNGSILNIVLVKHRASWIGRKAEAIIQRIIDNQSTNVDAISGATNSSRVIMNAVQNAVKKAYKQ